MERVNSNDREINPRENATWISALFFWWTIDVMKKGRKKPYSSEDLCAPLRSDVSNILGDRLEKKWNEELSRSRNCNKTPSLLRALINTFWLEFLVIAGLHFVNEFFISLSRPLLLGLFLRCYGNKESSYTSTNVIYYVGTAMILSYGLYNLLQNHFLGMSFRLGCKIKVALSSLIYRKCLRLGCTALRTTSPGQIVNLTSNDLRRFDEVIMYCQYYWSAPITTIIMLSVIYQKIGNYPIIVCVFSLFCFLPFQAKISKLQARNRLKIAKAADERIRTMDEIINGIYTIKVYAWEKPYTNLINVLRKFELVFLEKALYLRAVHVTIALFSSKFSMYATMIIFALMGGTIVPEIVFSLAAFFRIIARGLCAIFFRALGECSECIVSIRRLQNFMEFDEYEGCSNQMLHAEKSDNGDGKMAIKFQNFSAKWSEESTYFDIMDINLDVKIGDLTCIIGSIGSGKSSMINAILGELPPSEGKLYCNGSVSYYSQVPWIFGGSIRQNIIFCEKFDAEKYKTVVEVCALKHDFKLLPDGEFTLVGEKGVTLSGGQKARIALARSVYKEADIYLLDDPLSAVDVHVGKHIFEKCILGFLKHKTRVLVTHQLQFLRHADHIAVIDNGTIIKQGKLEDIASSGTNQLYLHGNVKQSAEDGLLQSHLSVESLASQCSTGTTKDDYDSKKKELEEEETDQTCRHALFHYFRRGIGIHGIFVLLIFYFISQVFVSMCDVWLSYWTGNNKQNTSLTDPSIHNYTTIVNFIEGPHSTEYFLYGYTIVIIGMLIFAFLRAVAMAYYSTKCCTRIHQDALSGVMYTDLTFFNNNPSGRILNRFSKDLGTVDESLPQCIADASVSFTQVLGAFVVTAAINPYCLIPGMVALCLLYYLRNFYLGTSVNLKRLEGITQSPVYVHIHATLHGLPVIRSNGSTQQLIREFDQLQDVHTATWYLYNYTTFGYVYCLEVVCFVYLVLIVIGSFIFPMSSSEVGLALIQAMTLLSFVQWAMKQGAEVSNQATSVDRLIYYTTLSPEVQPKDKLSEKCNWPLDGTIVFEDVSVQYDLNLIPSIRNISFTVLPRQKIGIVGRTGAGKTSLIIALFRLTHIEGSIKIDNVDTSNVPLQMLRSRISIIPQDPVLFSGTLRKNLDPFGEHTDAELWNAIIEVELQKTLQESDGIGLNANVQDGGRNFSVGQRQLICLARAIIRNNKILVLDEATANVDQQTDILIQQTIRKKFKFCTVLTIAHRLHTVVDSDKILVMESGILVEYGQPYELLQNPSGYFYNLVQGTGESTASIIMDIAKKNYVHTDS